MKPTLRPGHRDRDAGSALLIALMATVLLAAVGLGLLGLTNTEAAIATNVQAGHQSIYATDAGVEWALAEVVRTANWSDLTAGIAGSTFQDTTRTPLISGALVNLNAVTASLQADADGLWGPAAPRWHLFAYGSLNALTGRGGFGEDAYVAVWVGDDPRDGDANPVVDTNGIVMLVGRAWGPRASMRTITVSVERVSDPAATGGGVGPVGTRQRVMAWREVV
jgi:hypothetical protein